MTEPVTERAIAGTNAQTGARGVGLSTVDPFALFDAIDDIVTIVDSDGLIRGQNKASLRRLGIPPEDLIGKRFANLLLLADREQFLHRLEQLTKDDLSGFPLQVRLLDHENRLHRFEISAGAIAGTRPTRLYVLVSRSLTGEGLVSGLCRAGNIVGLWRFEFGAKEPTWSSDFYRFYGVEPNSIEERMKFGFARLHPDDRSFTENAFKTAFARKEGFSLRVRCLAGDGKYHLVQNHASPELDEKGGLKSIFGVCYDVSDEAESERALRDNELQYRHLLEEVSDVIGRIDSAGRYVYLSPASERLLGYAPDELVGNTAFDHIHPDDRDMVMSAFGRLFDGEDASTITHRSFHRLGHIIWLESTNRVVQRSADGTPEEIACVIRDITERKTAEDALAAARERAEAASATKSRFLANMSHEFRTPLNAIIGFSDIMRRELFGPVGSPRYKEYAQLILESGGHLLDLINDILDMSKIEAGKFELRLEELDLEELIGSCLKLVERRAQEASLVLHAKYGDGKPFVRADRRAIKQILLNLLSNAIKFTPAGGLVAVAVEGSADMLALRVSDTGVGISPEDLERVKQPFEQATDDPLLAKSGSGLGLSLVNSLAALHKGSVQIDSEVGRGTTVTVFLPYDPRTIPNAA